MKKRFIITFAVITALVLIAGVMQLGLDYIMTLNKRVN